MFHLFLRIFPLLVSWISLYSCKVYDGKCKNTDPSKAFKTLPNGLYWTAFQIPLQSYQQEVFFFPTCENQITRLYSDGKDFPMAFLDPWENSLSHRLHLAIYFNVESSRYEMFVTTWSAVLRRYTKDCLINKEFSTAIFAHLNAVLLWGCVNLDLPNKHEEALWLLVKEDQTISKAFSEIRDTDRYFERYKGWVFWALRNISSIPEDELDFYFLNERKIYKKKNSKSEENFQCPKSESRSLHYFIICVSLALLVLIFAVKH